MGSIEEWRNCPLESEYTYIYMDGIWLKRSWGGIVENVSILVAVGVNKEGYLEMLSNESSGDPQNERKLTPSVPSRGPGTGQRGSELAQLSVSFVRPYSRIFRENLRVL